MIFVRTQSQSTIVGETRPSKQFCIYFDKSFDQSGFDWSGWFRWSRWSDGQVVRWSGGQVVRWSGGQVVRWSGGQVVRWSAGQEVRWKVESRAESV